MEKPKQQPQEKEKPAACEPVPTDGSSKEGAAPMCPEGYPEEQPTDKKPELKTSDRTDRHSKST